MDCRAQMAGSDLQQPLSPLAPRPWKFRLELVVIPHEDRFFDSLIGSEVI